MHDDYMMDLEATYRRAQGHGGTWDAMSGTWAQSPVLTPYHKRGRALTLRGYLCLAAAVVGAVGLVTAVVEGLI